MTNDTVLKVGIVAKTKSLKYLSVPVNFSVSFSTVNSSIKLERLSNFRSSFSWEYGMGYILQRRSAWYEPRGEAMASPRGSYFSAAALGTRTSARGIFSTPSYHEKAGSPCVLKPKTIFRLTYPPPSLRTNKV